MGIDINAILMVGLDISELDMSKVPFYKEFCEEGNDKDDLSDFFRDYYYAKSRANPELKDLTSECIYAEDWYAGGTFFGFVIADSGSWDFEEIMYLDLIDKIKERQEQFEKIVGVFPSVFLFPRYW